MDSQSSEPADKFVGARDVAVHPKVCDCCGYTALQIWHFCYVEGNRVATLDAG